PPPGGSPPGSAPIAPPPTGTASCMNSPRRRTRRTASAKSSAPATTRAEYSPKLWPAASSGRMSCSASAAAAATLAVRTAGWVLAVSARSDSGPSQANRESGKPSAASGSFHTAAAAGEAWARSPPMPTAWDPCPGKRNATFTRRLPAKERGAPGEAAAEGRQEHEIAGAEPLGRPGLFHRHVDGGGAGIAVAVHVDDDLLHGDLEALHRRLDDPEVGLMRDEEVEVVGGEAVAGEDALGGLAEHAHRHLEHLVALHLRVVHSLVHPLVGRGLPRGSWRL